MGLLPDGDRRPLTTPGRRAGAGAGRGRRGVAAGKRFGRRRLTARLAWPAQRLGAIRPPVPVAEGLDEATAAFFVGLTALSTVIVRPLTGWLGDRNRSRGSAPSVCSWEPSPRCAGVQRRRPLAHRGLRHLVRVRRWHQLRDVGAGRRLLRPQPLRRDSGLDQHVPELRLDARRGAHRLDLRPDAELHVRADRLHHLLRRGRLILWRLPHPSDQRGSRPAHSATNRTARQAASGGALSRCRRIANRTPHR
jgi:hypothetical protein